MCNWGTTRDVVVKIDPSLSSTGREKWRSFPVDACIADIVEALQRGGIDMLSSCCGHGKTNGQISLADGRELVIMKERGL